MNPHPLLSIPWFALTFVAVLATSAPPAAAQTDGEAASDWVVPRTEHGHPNLQGNWSNATVTPLQRPEDRGPVLTPDEVAALEGRAVAALERSLDPVDPNRPPPPITGGTGGYDGFYFDRGDRVAVVGGEPRSSLVTRPADGRIPSLSAEGERRRGDYQAFRSRFGSYDHPELRPLGERCILSFGSSAGPPMLPNNFYNNNYTIVQTSDHVVILAEMVHDARIVHLGAGPRLPDDVRPWMGDSWGWWEGETLVVETTNFRPEQRFQGQSPSEERRVIERFTRVDEETILYEFTVDDPNVYSEPWGGEIPMHRFEDQLFEYACHEGNYALGNVLRGARWEESQEAEGRR